ncbi:MAG: hypothetical protein ACRCV3_01905 [Desulfovibrionaceae bacterium]
MNTINECRDICATIDSICKKYNGKAYLVGGSVRDYILYIMNHKVVHEGLFNDIDIVIELSREDPEDLLFVIYEKIKVLFSLHCTYFREYFTIKAESSTVNIDIAYARKEEYCYRGSLPPKITIVYSIKEDILRRDFRCNTFAMSLRDAIHCMDTIFKENRYGIAQIFIEKEENRTHSTCEIDSKMEYIYFYTKGDTRKLTAIGVKNALEDCKNKKLCVIHARSFYDDPTRILRMLSFVAQFTMNIEVKTHVHMREALQEKCFEDISSSRVKKEIDKAYQKNDIFLLSVIYIQEGIINALFKEYSAEEQKKLISSIEYLKKTQYRSIFSKKEQIYILYCIFSGDFLSRSKKNVKKYMKYIWESEEYSTIRSFIEECRISYTKRYSYMTKDYNEREYVYDLMSNKKKIVHLYLLFLVDDKKKKLVEDFLTVCYTGKGKVLVSFESMRDNFPLLKESMRAYFYKRLTKMIFVEEAYSREAQYIIALVLSEELLLEK